MTHTYFFEFFFSKFVSMQFFSGSQTQLHIGVGASKFLGVRRIFAQMFPNLPEKLFFNLCPTNLLSQRMWRPVLGVTSKKGIHSFFCKRWAPFFVWIFRDFAQISVN